MDHVSEGPADAGSASERTASLLAEIAAVLRVDPSIFFDGAIRDRVGRERAVDELTDLIALFRSVDGPDLRRAAHDLIRTLKPGDEPET